MARPRYVLAFALSPAVPALLWGAYILVVGFVGGGNRVFANAVTVAAVAGLIAYAHAILLGIPTVLILARLGRLGLLRVLVASALIGAIPATIWLAQAEFGDSSSSFWFDGVALKINGELTLAGWINKAADALQFAASGAAAGLAWWWISGASSARPQRESAV